jgi:hypothetical protein
MVSKTLLPPPLSMHIPSRGGGGGSPELETMPLNTSWSQETITNALASSFLYGLHECT